MSSRASIIRTRRSRWFGVILCAAIALSPTLLPGSALAVATTPLASWEMNEPRGATTMLDSSGNGINGTIGSAVVTGVVFERTSVGYRWPSTNPIAPPAKPERLIQVGDASLNPGSREYAVSLRFKTTHGYVNILQKGQSGSRTGYFKLQIENQKFVCLFRGLNSSGSLVQRSVTSGTMLVNDGLWHTARCERTSTGVVLTIDGVTRQVSGWTGTISNSVPLTIGGKLNCDQITVTCDYYSGMLDYVRIQAN